MKFGRLLRDAIPELPELESLFRCYKQLKKQIKRYPRASGEEESVGSASLPLGQHGEEESTLSVDDARVGKGQQRCELTVDATAQAVNSSGLDDGAGPSQQRSLSENEAEFAEVLHDHLQTFNNMFVEKEDAAELRLQELEAASARASSPAEAHSVYQSLKQYHGDMLLLMHWSILAYTSTVKILKKHHKHTGHLLQAPSLEDLLMQPFCSTEVCTGLLASAEEHMRGLMEQMGQGSGEGPPVVSQHSLYAQLNLGETLGLRSNLLMEGSLPPSGLNLKQGLDSAHSEYAHASRGLPIAPLAGCGSGSFSAPGNKRPPDAQAEDSEAVAGVGSKRARSSSGANSDRSAGHTADNA